MDNLTHSLVGALLGQMGLKRKTGLAMPTLIIAANIPDIDAVTVLLGGQQHLALRRGITHGPIAMVLLPLLLWAAMLWFDQWQTKRGTRPEERLPVHNGWLLALAFIGCLSHPLFDWFNSYGVRLLEPFSSQWFYGDTLFIIDVWIWAILIGGIFWSRRVEKTGVNWQRPAQIMAVVGTLYVFANGVISKNAVSDVAFDLISEPSYAPKGKTMMANPVPFVFWKREVLVKFDEEYRTLDYTLFSGADWTRPRSSGLTQLRKHDLAGAIPNPELESFLFWSRMPVVVDVNGWVVTVGDARFVHSPVGNRFTVNYQIRHDDTEWIE